MPPTTVRQLFDKAQDAMDDAFEELVHAKDAVEAAQQKFDRSVDALKALMMDPQNNRFTAKAPKGPAAKPTQTRGKGHGATGLTDKVAKAFADGKPHVMGDLSARFNVSSAQMKKAVYRLLSKKAIKRVGEEGSGKYTLAKKPKT